MTQARWEYAAVIWVDEAKKFLKSDPEYARLSPEVKLEWEQKEWAYYWWKEQKYYIWFPGAEEADVRHAWTTGEEKAKVHGLDILNELGAEGWEAVSHTIRRSAMGPSLGRDTAGYPVETHILLKRAVA